MNVIAELNHLIQDLHSPRLKVNERDMDEVAMGSKA